MLLSDAIKSARVYLNDTHSISWTDAILLPLAQEAHGELLQELELHRSSYLRVQTEPVVVPAGTKTLPNQPTNIIDPITMLEGDIGANPDSFELMEQVTFLPYVNQDTWLTYWAWIAGQIVFLGATTDRQVVLRYTGTIPTPTRLTDSLGIVFAEHYIGPRTAALAKASANQDATFLQTIADKNLYKLVQSQVVGDQRPVRRKAYRSPKPMLGLGERVSVPAGGIPSSGGTPVTWVVSSTTPDGVVTQFAFSRRPVYVSYNGVNQFEGLGYDLSHVGGTYYITLKDVLGNVITPATGDDIRAEVS